VSSYASAISLPETVADVSSAPGTVHSDTRVAEPAGSSSLSVTTSDDVEAVAAESATGMYVSMPARWPEPGVSGIAVRSSCVRASALPARSRTVTANVTGPLASVERTV